MDSPSLLPEVELLLEELKELTFLEVQSQQTCQSFEVFELDLLLYLEKVFERNQLVTVEEMLEHEMAEKERIV